ncbi:capsular polysaccharide export protein, LipB/KpsS family [Paracoccus caeni]|uniref:capsular polysaccharide export protein, LipB/KpsS family n=1 Tax=Paracoccus caeni TaxID=657651 RepID=UPI00190B165C|nr:hypothetical protein [Paracoccus caeni]
MAIYNPYMQSHRRFQGLFYLAKKRVETIVIERGALPGTIYYSDDVAYGTDKYSEESFSNYKMSSEDEEIAKRYIDNLRLGGEVLESGASYAFTSRKYEALSHLDRKIVFLPLQMSEDMAVTMFLRDSQDYGEYERSINAVAASNPEALFIIKPHPLTKGETDFRGSNIIIADREDNIHALIEISDATICYNSGVSLLAMAHYKQVVTVGNAYFNRGGAGQYANSLSTAVAMVLHGTANAVSEENVVRLYSWLVNQMYSRFKAKDDIREFSHRKAHGYKDIIVTHLNLNGMRINSSRARTDSNDIFETLGFSLMNFGKSQSK